MSFTSLILPYIVEDAERKKPFSHAMEVAAVLCLVEAKRGKGGILGGSPERVSFVSKLYYPLWAVPWDEDSLIVDGLGFLSHTVTHMEPPDVESFTEDLKKGASVRSLYRDALRRHISTFKGFTASLQVSMEAVVGDESLLSALAKYITPTSLRKGKMDHSLPLIPPRLNQKAAVEGAGKAINHWRQIQSEIKGLQYAINVLNEGASPHDEGVLREIEQIREEYEKEVVRLRPVVEKKVKQLMTEQDNKIKRISQGAERELKTTFKKRDRYERELKKLERSIDGYRQKREARRRKGDKRGMSQWDSRIRACQKELSEARRQIRSLSRLVNQLERQREAEIEKLNRSYEGMIYQERKKISDLEAARDSEIEAKEREIEELRSETSLIISLIEQLMEQKASCISDLKELTIPWRPEEVTLICVPHYLVRYEVEGKFRYDVYPPAVAEDHEGILKKIQRALWSFSVESRINLLLRPRSEALEEMLTSIFVKGMYSYRALEKVVRGMGRSNDLLKAPDLREELVKGLEELRREGWISSEERYQILNSYAPSTMVPQ